MKQLQCLLRGSFPPGSDLVTGSRSGDQRGGGAGRWSGAGDAGSSKTRASQSPTRGLSGG